MKKFFVKCVCKWIQEDPEFMAFVKQSIGWQEEVNLLISKISYANQKIEELKARVKELTKEEPVKAPVKKEKKAKK